MKKKNLDRSTSTDASKAPQHAGQAPVVLRKRKSIATPVKIVRSSVVRRTRKAPSTAVVPMRAEIVHHSNQQALAPVHPLKRPWAFISAGLAVFALALVVVTANHQWGTSKTSAAIAQTPAVRDDQRKQDLDELKAALERYYQKNGTYQVANSGWKGGSQGWVSYEDTGDYRRSVARALQEEGFLTRADYNPPSQGGATGYMLYHCEAYKGFSLTATLENPSPADITTAEQSCNGIGGNGTVPRYGKNYSVSGGGLVGQWNFSEGTDATVADSSGNSNNGTINNGATWVDGKVGKAVRLDGTNDYIDLGNSANLQPQKVSLSLWFKTDTAGMMLRKRLYGYGLEVLPSKQVSFWIYNAAATKFSATSPNTYADNAWHNATGVYDGASVKLFIDGVLVATNNAGAIYYGAGAIAVGRDGDNGGQYLKGSIDEVKIYNRALSVAEVGAPFCNEYPVGSFRTCFYAYNLGHTYTDAEREQSITAIEKGALLATQSTTYTVGGTTESSPAYNGYWRDGEVANAGRSEFTSGVWRTTLPAGTYTFHVLADDGIVVEVDGKGRVINAPGSAHSWNGQAPTRFDSQSVVLNDPTAVAVKWYEHDGYAVMNFWWDYTAPTASVVPGLVGQWNFDNGSTRDTSGNSNNGEPTGAVIANFNGSPDGFTFDCGGNPVTEYVDGKNGKALKLWAAGGDGFACAIKSAGALGVGHSVYFWGKGYVRAQLWTGSESMSRVEDVLTGCKTQDGSIEMVQSCNGGIPYQDWRLFRVTAFKGGNGSLFLYNGGRNGIGAGDKSYAGYYDLVTTGPSVADGKDGKALKFDGVENFVQIPNSASLQIADNLSVSAWINPTAFTPYAIAGPTIKTGTRILDKNTAGTGDGWLLDELNGKLRFIVGSVGSIISTSTLPLNTWTHVAGVYDHAQMRLYINGKLDGTLSGSASIPTNTLPLLIGASQGLSTVENRFNGLIDDVKIYNTALNSAQIANNAGGPVAQWNFDEGSGTSTTDSSGNGNTGTFTNGAQWGVGVRGKAIQLNGVNDYVRVASPTALPMGNSPRTQEAWIYPRSFPDKWYTGIFVFGQPACGYGSLLSIKDDGRLTMAFWCNDAYQTVGPIIPLNAWTHVAYTYDTDDKIRFYVNGQLVQEAPRRGQAYGTNPIPETRPGPVRIGCTDDPGRCFDGFIDEVKIYDRALTSGEMRTEYGSPIAEWHFDEGSGTSVADSSGNNYTGTINGGSQWVNGVKGKAIQLNGTNQYAEIPNANSLNASKSFSVSVWFKGNPKAASVDDRRQLIIDHSHGFSDQTGWVMQTRLAGEVQSSGAASIDGELGFGFGDGATFLGANSKMNVLDGKLHHAVGTYDGTAIRMYIDGQLKESYPFTGAPVGNSRSVRIGAAAGFTGVPALKRFFNGTIDEVEIYNRALTPAEVIEESQMYRIEAEDFDANGADCRTDRLNGTCVGKPAQSGLDYTDADVANNGVGYGENYRPTGVDVYDMAIAGRDNSSAIEIGHGIGWLNVGEVTQYSRVLPAGHYKVRLRYVSNLQAPQVTVRVKTKNQTYPFTFTPEQLGNRGSWFGMYTVEHPQELAIPIDSQRVSLTIDTTALNIDWLEFVPVAEGNGLVAQWRFDENSGTTAADSSANSNTATLQGGVSWVNGVRQKAVQLDGTNGYVAKEYDASNPLFNISTKLTYSLWVKPQKGMGVLIGRQQCDNAWPSAELSLGGTAPNFTVQFLLNYQHDNTYTTFTSPAVVAENQWSHVAATYDKDSKLVKIYLNGNEVFSGTYDKTIWKPTTSLWIGGIPKPVFDPACWEDYGNGTVDDVKIYNRALSAAEIADEASALPVTKLDLNALGLVGEWKFDNGSLKDTKQNKDATNNGANGAVVASDRNGVASSAYEFTNSAHQYINAGVVDAYRVSQALTMESWIYPTGPGDSPSGGIIVNKEGEYELARWPDGHIYYAIKNVAPDWIWMDTNYTAPLNTWVHLVFTYSSADQVIVLYANGQEVYRNASASGLIGDYSSVWDELRIGGRQYAEVQYFDGKIDTVRIYNAAMSATNAKALYDAEIAPPQEETTGFDFSTRGLVGEWNMDNGSAADSSGNGNNGSVWSATMTDDRNGAGNTALNFDGSANADGSAQQYMTIPNASVLNPQDEATFEVWAYPRDVTKHQNIFEKVNTDNNRSYMLYMGPPYEIAGKNTFRPHISTTNGNWRYGAIDYNIDPNQWYHVVYTYKASTGEMKGYINGAPYPMVYGSGYATPKPGERMAVSTAEILLGLDARDPIVKPFNGKLDTFRIYDTAMSEVDVKALYDAQTAVVMGSSAQSSTSASYSYGQAMSTVQAAPNIIATPDRLQFFASECDGALHPCNSLIQKILLELSDKSIFRVKPLSRRLNIHDSRWLKEPTVQIREAP